MIFEFSSEFAEFDADDWQPYCYPLQNLLNVHKQGWHIVSPSREVCQSLVRSEILSEDLMDFFKHHIQEKISTRSGQARSSQLVVVCKPNNSDQRTDYDNQVCVPLAVYANLDNCSRSRLITENSDRDGKLLTSLCNLMSRELGSNLTLTLECVHGGGSSVSRRYNDALQVFRPALCVVDSDRDYFNGPLGGTARNLSALHNPNVLPVIQLYVLPVRELENVIPISVLYDVYFNDPHVRTKIQSLCDYILLRENGQQLVEGNVLSFFDMKNGITRSKILSFPLPAKQLFYYFDVNTTGFSCDYDDYNEPEEEYVVHAGVSENLLDIYLGFLELNQFNRPQLIQKYKNMPEWTWLSELLKLIMAYGAGQPRLPIT